MKGARAVLRASLVVLLFAASAHAQTVEDDAAGWSTPAAPPAEEPAPVQAAPVSADDVAGWGAPVSAPQRASADPDDAAGWGSSSPSVVAASAPVVEERSARTLPRVDAKFRDRKGFWMRDAGFAEDASRIAQARVSLDVSASYAPTFRVADTEGSFRVVAGVRGEYDLVYRLQQDSAGRALIDSQAYRIIGQESYLALRIGGFEVKAGRMIMPLGTGEVISTLDLLNPRDLRQPGLVDNENMRLAVLSSRASLTVGKHLLEALVVHESYFGLLPPILGRFSPLRKLLLQDSGSDRLGNYQWRFEHHPERLDPGGTQAIGHYGFTGSGLDLDFYMGSALDQLGAADSPPATAFDFSKINLDIYHPRYTLVASSGALTAGSFLLRWEIGAQLNRSQTLRVTNQPVLITEIEKRNQVNGLLGLTFFGIPNGVMSAEVMQSVVLDNPARRESSNRELLFPVEATNIAFRYQQNLFSEKLSLELIALVIGVDPFNGALVRGDLGYNFRDGLAVHVIYAHYRASDDFGLLYGFDKNDRLDASFSWAFGTP